MACGTVKSHVSYLKDLPLYRTEKPFQIFTPIDPKAPDQRSSNLEFETKEHTFHDIRDQISECSLDSHGFALCTQPTKLPLSAFRDRQTVESEYFPEVRKVLERIEGGYDRVFIFDWRLRDSATPKHIADKFDMNDLTTWLRPSPTAHVDQSDRAVLRRVLLHLGEDANHLLRGRVRVINAWRPIDSIIEESPLAFCDPASVDESDLIECDHVRRRFQGSTMYAHYNEGHKWCYVGQHHPDEILLLKMFDSDTSVAARRLLHASFQHPSTTQTSRSRKSIEVRALVFNYSE